MSNALDDRRARFEPMCGENVPLTLKSITEGYSKRQDGSDNMYIRANFLDLGGNKVMISFFNPGPNQRKRTIQAIHLGSLCSAIGLDLKDITYSHDFETFVGKLIKFTKGKWGSKVYAKLTLDEQNWLIPGEGEAFSAEDNLVYTELDKSNLSVDDLDKYKSIA